MNTTFKILMGLSFSLSLAACSGGSSVTFKGGRAINANPNDKITSPIEQTGGGVMAHQTNSGYKASTSFQTKLDHITAKTSGGYSVSLGIQGQVAP